MDQKTLDSATESSKKVPNLTDVDYNNFQYALSWNAIYEKRG